MMQISESLTQLIHDTVPAGGAILEIGSGAGTAGLAAGGRRIFSIESESFYISEASVAVCYSPIVDNWYDHKAVAEFIAGREFDACLVDGPPGSIGRDGILEHWEALRSIPMVVIDDTHRPAEAAIASALANRLGRVPEVGFDGDREYTVLRASPRPQKALDVRVMVRSSYNDAEASRRRLAISRETVLPCLASQIDKPIVCLHVSHDDPLLASRLAAFEETGCQVETAFDSQSFKELTFTGGWRVTARLDDDDTIDRQFYSDIRLGSGRADRRQCWTYPNGRVFINGRFHGLRVSGNQFIALQTNKDETPFDFVHGRAGKYFPFAIAGNRAAWIWIRHRTNKSRLPRGYSTRRRVGTGGLFAIDWKQLKEKLDEA